MNGKKKSNGVQNVHRDYEHLAKNILISQKKCSRNKSEKYSVICYGDDLNILDPSRKWIYEAELAEGERDTERARIAANKVVLYVNRDELDTIIHQLLAKDVAV